MKELLYGWEINKLIPHPNDDKKKMRITEIIAAETIQQVWDYLEIDRADEATEIESIGRFGPIIKVLPKVSNVNESQTNI